MMKRKDPNAIFTRMRSESEDFAAGIAHFGVAATSLRDSLEDLTERLFLSTNSTVTNTPSHQTNITPEALKHLADQLADIDQRDHIRKWMISQGFDPEKGCWLVMPANLKDHPALTGIPFVKFSDLVDQPVMFNARSLGL